MHLYTADDYLEFYFEVESEARSRDEYEPEAYATGYIDGAAAISGLIAMAQAIQDRERSRPRRELDAYYDRTFRSSLDGIIVADVDHQLGED